VKEIRSILKPDTSVGAAIGTFGVVYGTYSASVGPVSQAHAADPNHPSLENSRKKAGVLAFAFVSALGLITRDGNVVIAGYAAIIGMELAYRSAIMAEPSTGKLIVPAAASYTEAVDNSNVVPIDGYDDTSGVMVG
jgi:hypothetical protein